MPSLAWKLPWNRRALDAAQWKCCKIRILTICFIQCKLEAVEADCQETERIKSSYSSSQNKMRWRVIIQQVYNVSSGTALWLRHCDSVRWLIITGSVIIGWISWLWPISFSWDTLIHHKDMHQLLSTVLLSMSLFVLYLFDRSITDEQSAVEITHSFQCFITQQCMIAMQIFEVGVEFCSHTDIM